MTLTLSIIFIAGLLMLGYRRSPAWTVMALALGLWVATSQLTTHWLLVLVLALTTVGFGLIAFRPLRRSLVSAPLFGWFKGDKKKSAAKPTASASPAARQPETRGHPRTGC